MGTKVICLIGGCGAGKNYVLNRICKNFNVHTIVTHTTRPMRRGEIEGKDYHYISKEQFENMLMKNQFIEHRVYNVIGDVWSYGVAITEIAKEKNNILIVDGKGYLDIKKYCECNDIECISIYLKTNLEIRINRYMKRNKNGKDNAAFYYEMCRRILDDYENVECFENTSDYIFKNDNILDLQQSMKIIGDILND